MENHQYKGVWVYVEEKEGFIEKVSLELIGKGKELAKKLGAELTAILLCKDKKNMAEECLRYGADKVILALSDVFKNYTTGPYAKVIYDMVNEKKPEVLLIGATYTGRDLAPRIAAKLGTGLTADCTGLEIEDETGNCLMTRPAFGGNLIATIVCTEKRPQMATVRPGVFEMPLQVSKDIGKNKIEQYKVELSNDDLVVKILKIVKEEKVLVDITKTDIIVAGGRGIGNKENFELLKALANKLKAGIAGSRAAVESGWIDKSLQVGQTGKTVRPKLYIACGISGAIQHLSGMQDSDYIIAINKDENAPIMNVADLGLVGDFKEILPKLIEKLSI